jgi:hypothetical protein
MAAAVWEGASYFSDAAWGVRSPESNGYRGLQGILRLPPHMLRFYTITPFIECL